MRYVVVDIETTGGRPSGNSITEIGIAHVEHNKIVHQWSSFVRPDHHIPLNIQQLTGITNEMVADAPTFEELAHELLEHLTGEVFVAHSVNFDYSFIEGAFKQIGRSWRMNKLCTVKYSRAMFPEFGRFSLANLARQLGIFNENPHRALSDALTAAEVLIHCLIADSDQKKLNDPKLGLLKRIQLPDFLPAEEYDNLPKSNGVYIFEDLWGQPLYVGKAKNIKSRITQHFSTDQEKTKYQRLMKECYHINYELFPNETLSLIYEDHLIRAHWPPLNKAQKGKAHRFGVYAFENRGGEVKWVVQKIQGAGALRKFGSYVSASQWLAQFHLECDRSEISIDRRVKHLMDQNNLKCLVPLENEGGALFVDRGHVVGIYKKDDFIYTEQWVRDNFMAISSSPTIDAIASKKIEHNPDGIVLL